MYLYIYKYIYIRLYIYISIYIYIYCESVLGTLVMRPNSILFLFATILVGLSALRAATVGPL